MTQLTFGSKQSQEQLEKDSQLNTGLDIDKMREKLIGNVKAHENSPFVDFTIDNGLFITGQEMAEFISEFHRYGGVGTEWIFEFLKNFVANMEILDNEKLHKIAAILFDKTGVK